MHRSYHSDEKTRANQVLLDDYHNEQEKFNEGLVRLVGYETNVEKDDWVNVEEAIGNFGVIRFQKNELSFNIYPIFNRINFSKYSEKSIIYNYNPEFSNTPYFREGNNLITVKVEDISKKHWWIIIIEAKTEKAEELNEKLEKIMLSDECFIATTVYGDKNCPEVQKLRYWRDSFLRKSYFGNAFIQYYYKKGKKWAFAIKSRPKTKKTIKICLNIFTFFLRKN